jgi:hypothetical protein
LWDNAPRAFGGGLAVLMVGDSGAGEGFGIGGKMIAVVASASKPAVADCIQPPDHLFDGQFRKKFW